MNDKEMVQITLNTYEKLKEKIETEKECKYIAYSIIEKLLINTLDRHFKKQTKIKSITPIPNSLMIRFNPIDEDAHLEYKYLTYDELFNIVDISLKSDKDTKDIKLFEEIERRERKEINE